MTTIVCHPHGAATAPRLAQDMRAVAEQAESGISVDQLAIFLGLGGDWQTRAGVT